MAELVLVRPGISHPIEAHWGKVPPLGLGYLAASCRRDGVDVDVVDAKLLGHRKIVQTVKCILDLNPQFVGISAMTMEFPNATRIASTLKRYRPDLITILGGVHANALPAESLGESSAFDYLIIGEGETALPRIIKSLKKRADILTIPGLYAKDGDGNIINKSPAVYQNVNSLPFPAWDLFPRTQIYPIITERGCPYRCVFCSRNMGKKLRTRSLDNVIEEIRWLYSEMRPREIYFEDETFGLNPDRTCELLEFLVEFNQDKNIVFKAQTRVDRISEKMLRLMNKAGFRYLELGVESGDTDVLSRTGKGISLAQAEEAVKLVKKVGLNPWLNFIIGLPGENEVTVRNMIRFSVKLNPDWLSVALIVAYPGSEIYEWAKKGEFGYRLVSDDWSSFDKYIGARTVELESFHYKKMRYFQIRMYLETFLRNFRIKEFLRLIWETRRFVLG